MPSPLEAIHEQHQLAQKQSHERMQSEQAATHAQHQMNLKSLHGRHAQEMKQMHQKHSLHHEQVTGSYEKMPPEHVNEVAKLIGMSHAQEHQEMLNRHAGEVRDLHNQHFQQHLREHIARNQG